MTGKASHQGALYVGWPFSALLRTVRSYEKLWEKTGKSVLYFKSIK